MRIQERLKQVTEAIQGMSEHTDQYTTDNEGYAEDWDPGEDLSIAWCNYYVEGRLNWEIVTYADDYAVYRPGAGEESDEDPAFECNTLTELINWLKEH